MVLKIKRQSLQLPPPSNPPSIPTRNDPPLHSCSVVAWSHQVCDLLEGLIPASPEERKNMSAKHLEHLFIFSLLWSLGALLELDDRLKMQEFMRKHKSKLSYPKLEGEETIFEFLVAHDGQYLRSS